MSLLDMSLVALWAVPVIFFVGVAYLYCKHAKLAVERLRRRNKRLAQRYGQLTDAYAELTATNEALKERLLFYGTAEEHKSFGL